MPASPQTTSLRFYRLLVVTLFTAMVIICVLFGTILLQTWREYKAISQQEAELRVRLESLQQQNEYQRQYLMKLLDDPQFFEKVVRARLGYSRPGEIIFKFDKQ